MLRAPKTRTIFYVALIVAAIMAVSAIPQLSAAVKEGRTLTLVEDIILDLLIGCFVFVGPAGLMLWHQLRRLDRYQQTINDEKRKLDTAINHMTQGLVMFDSAQRIDCAIGATASSMASHLKSSDRAYPFATR